MSIESNGNAVIFTAMSTLNEINRKASRVLRTALGPVDYARYRQQFSPGSGDYTEEREPGETAEVVRLVRDMKSEGRLTPPPKARILSLDD